MTANPAKSWMPVTFVLGSVLMAATIVYAVLGEVVGLYPASFHAVYLGFGASFVAASAGLLALAGGLRRDGLVLARLGAGLAGLAGVGGLIWVVLGFLALPPWEIAEPYASIVILGTLGALVTSLAVLGIVTWRAGTYPRTVSALLLVGGLAFVGPLADALGWRPLEWLPAVIGLSWVAIFLGVGLALRAPRSKTPQAVAANPQA